MPDTYQPFRNYRELLTLVSTLCEEGRTGSLFVISETNSLARIVIVAGNIIHFEYRLKKGSDAIPLFREIETGSFDFKDGKVISHKPAPLPATETVLAQLGGKPVKPAAQAPAAGAGSGATRRASTAEALEQIEQQLVDVLGPMGALVWEEHLERAGGADADLDLRQLIKDVATEIDDPEKAIGFRNRLLQGLG